MALALFGGNAAMAQFAQTPVNISSSKTTVAPYANKIRYHYQPTTVTLVNTFGAKDENGVVIPKEFATLKANVPPGSYVIVDGVSYNLLQFHFHQPSEHTLNGNRSPMEVHFVHLKSSTQDSRTPGVGYGDCRLADRPVLVIGAFIVPGSSDHELQKVFASEHLPTDSDGLSVSVDLDLAKLLPDAHTWQYLGGLTAPSTTCNSATMVSQLATDNFPEIVRWFVLQEMVHLPMDDIDKFHELFEEGNSRPVQKLNGRPVFVDEKHKKR